MADVDVPEAAMAARDRAKLRLPSGFWRMWGAVGLSNLGDAVTFVAAGLLAVTLTDDSRLVSVVVATGYVGWLVLALPAGVVVDRFDRRRLLVLANLVRVLVFGAIAMLAVTDRLSIWVLVALLALAGACEVVFDSTAQAVPTMLVPTPLLARANGLFSGAEIVAGAVLGLAIGAVLFDVGVGVPFATNALAYAVAATLVLTVAFRYTPPPDPDADRDRGMRSSFVWLWRNDLLRLLSVLTAVAAISYMLSVGVIAQYAVVELELSSIEFGIFVSVNAIGAATGGLISSWSIDLLGTRLALVVSYGLGAAGLLVIGLLDVVWTIAAVYAVVGMTVTVWNVTTLTIRHRIIPPEQFGRVNGIYRWMLGLSNLGGSLLGGVLAHTTSLPMTFTVGGVVMLGFGVLAAAPLGRALASGLPDLPEA